MTMLHSTTADAFTPEDYGKLVDLAVKAKSIAAKSATVVPTTKVKINFPIWTADPAVGWYNENDEIAETDGDTDEVECTPSKTAGLTPISNELADDSDPDVAEQVSKGLANQITRSIDAAYLGNTTAKGPNGLLSISYTPGVVGASLTNLDAFVSARFAAVAHGSELTSWIVSPAVAEQLSKLKTASGSNQPLIEFVEDGITVAGLPVLVSDQVDADTVAWGIPADHVKFVMRLGTKVEKFPNVQRDGIWLRAISRLGVAFVNEPGVVRLLLSPIEYTLTVSGGSSGSDHYTLKVNGVETASIAYNANAAAIKSAIVAVDDGIAADDVTVTGSGPFTVSLPATLAHGTDAGATTTAVAVS
jgi:HK97 family phage major capsid protein